MHVHAHMHTRTCTCTRTHARRCRPCRPTRRAPCCAASCAWTTWATCLSGSTSTSRWARRPSRRCVCAHTQWAPCAVHMRWVLDGGCCTRAWAPLGGRGCVGAWGQAVQRGHGRRFGARPRAQAGALSPLPRVRQVHKAKLRGGRPLSEADAVGLKSRRRWRGRAPAGPSVAVAVGQGQSAWDVCNLHGATLEQLKELNKGEGSARAVCVVVGGRHTSAAHTAPLASQKLACVVLHGPANARAAARPCCPGRRGPARARGRPAAAGARVRAHQRGPGPHRARRQQRRRQH